VKELVHIPVDSVVLEGELAIPSDADAVVLFAHGSGSSRRSPRNQYVAQVLRASGLGTLLMDLLTPQEDADYETRFDIDLLTNRLENATRWVAKSAATAALAVGYFGASTGAAAALRAAAALGPVVSAVVSRGGRPDLAWTALEQVTAPTLLIVGGLDDIVIDLNQRAYKRLKAEKELKIIPGATHLFEEPGALEEVARLASEWFERHLCRRPDR
jgi:putative phosphoribosyl transferase